jgi:hypothetical protein
MKFPAIILALASCAACFVLPDRIQVGIEPSPLAELHPALGDFESHAISIRAEYDLQPTEVIIAGQREGHPWDFGKSLGLYGGDDNDAPTPITVADEELRDKVAALVAKNTHMEESLDQLEEDSKAIRSAFDDMAAFLRLLGGGSGGVGLLALIFGGRAMYQRRHQPQPEE